MADVSEKKNTHMYVQMHRTHRLDVYLGSGLFSLPPHIPTVAIGTLQQGSQERLCSSDVFKRFCLQSLITVWLL